MIGEGRCIEGVRRRARGACEAVIGSPSPSIKRLLAIPLRGRSCERPFGNILSVVLIISVVMVVMVVMIVTSWNGNARRDNADAITIMMVMVMMMMMMVIVRVDKLCDLNVGDSFRRLCGAPFRQLPSVEGQRWGWASGGHRTNLLSGLPLGSELARGQLEQHPSSLASPPRRED